MIIVKDPTVYPIDDNFTFSKDGDNIEFYYNTSPGSHINGIDIKKEIEKDHFLESSGMSELEIHHIEIIGTVRVKNQKR